ncbi:hypothetical protein ES705_11392 [subsurface metagenome]
MQDLLGLDISDFKKGLVIVIGKIEIDWDGTGTDYKELPDVRDFSVDTNIEDEVSRFCAYSFTITCLNTDKRYFSWNTASPYYNWLKQGRRIKIYAGIRVNSIDYHYQWIIGRIDRYHLSTVAGEEICTITGRDFMRAILDFKLYSPNTYWGTTQTFDTEELIADYQMNDDCRGIYIAYLDSISPYDGSHLYPIYRSLDFEYVESTNKFSFLNAKIPNYDGTNNLIIYYYQTKSIESIVGDILISSGILQAKISGTTISFSDSNPDTILDSDDNFVIAGFKSGQIITVVTGSGTNNGTYTISAVTPGVITLIGSDELITESAATAVTVTITTNVNLVSKTEWLADTNHVTPTGKEIDRVWFETGTSAFEAIRLLAEIAQWRFYFDYKGNPIFKPKLSIGTSVDTFSDRCVSKQEVSEDIDEIYNHIIVIGESRETLG